MVAASHKNAATATAAVTLVDLCRPLASNGDPKYLASNDGQLRRTFIVTLPDPGTGEERQYLALRFDCDRPSDSTLVNIYELNCVSSSDNKYGVYFVGSRVVSDGAMRAATRLDPLYFLLSAVCSKSAGAEKMAHKWQPLDQALDGIGLLRTVRDALGVDGTTVAGAEPLGGQQLRHLFDRNDQLGDDLVLYRFSEKRAVDWLLKKHECAVEAIKCQMVKSKRRQVEESTYREEMCGGGGAFNSTFVMGPVGVDPNSEQCGASKLECDPSEVTLTMIEERGAKAAGLQVISEYLSDSWRMKLVEALDMSTNELMGEKRLKKNTKIEQISDDALLDSNSSANSKKRRAAWEARPGEDAAEDLIQLTMGVEGYAKSKEDMAKKDKLNTQSVGLKKLAKVNTRGMKRMASFFGWIKKKGGA